MNGYGTSNVTMDMDINVNSFRRLQQHEILHHPLTRVPTTMNRNHPELRPRYPTQLQTADVSTADNQLPDLQLSTALSTDAAEDGMPAASDFVRKLFRMLEDPAFSNIVCWGSQRDCFIVKDMTEFTKVILPRLFKHSNFASFVRQLNKYDFHKVKNTDENAYGEHCWTFRHPKFRADHLDGLEDIKRKSAPARRSTGRTTQVSQSKSPTDPSSSKDIPVAETAVVSDLQTQIDGLLQTQHDLKSHIITLETNYRSVLDEMATFQRGMASQDALIQNLLQHLINYEQPRSGDPALTKPLGTLETNFVSEEAQRMMSTSNYNPEDVARASLQQLTELSRRANRVPAGSGAPQPHSNIRITTSNIPQHGDMVRSETHPRLQPSEAGIPASTTLTSPSTAGPSLDWSSHKGLQVLTVGHLLPRAAHASTDEMEIEEQVMPSTTYSNSTQGPGTRLRVRRKTYVPGWAVPPRVLLVEDDAVSRKLSSKFLQVLGVTADIAVDGDAAVKQMCLERYDLVLMDIVMPRLDGVAATSLIRQFDHRTPIISMTSNSCPQDILNYYSHGMNDILPKPFTRDGLFSMLEKHLNHLKSIQRLSLPRSLDDSSDRLQEVVETTESTFQTEGESSLQFSTANPTYPINSFTNAGPINTLSGLGANEEQQYSAMLASMSGDLFTDSPGRSIGVKRSAPDPNEPDSNIEQHPAKRGRFDSEQ